MEESCQVATATTTKRQSNLVEWAHQHYKQKLFALGDHGLWFLKSKKTHHGKFKWQWFVPYQIQYCLFNKTILLVMVNKFDPHPILVSVNKLKPYQLFAVSQGWEPWVQGGRGRGGGDPNEQLEMEDDTQSEMDSHLVITPSEQFFDNELEKIVI